MIASRPQYSPITIVRALRAHLSGDALAEVLPALRTVDPEGRHLSHGRAMDIVWSLGTAGGNPTRPEGALDWAKRAARREPDLIVQLERARAAADDPERSGLARTARDLERLLSDLRAVRPAIEALVGVARLVSSSSSTRWWVRPSAAGSASDSGRTSTS